MKLAIVLQTNMNWRRRRKHIYVSACILAYAGTTTDLATTGNPCRRLNPRASRRLTALNGLAESIDRKTSGPLACLLIELRVPSLALRCNIGRCFLARPNCPEFWRAGPDRELTQQDLVPTADIQVSPPATSTTFFATDPEVLSSHKIFQITRPQTSKNLTALFAGQ